MSKFLNIVALLVVIWGIKYTWNWISAEPVALEERTPEQWAADDDAWIAAEIAGGEAAVAAGWLDQEKHGTFEGDPVRMRQAIAAFEEGGAPQVWMVGIESLGQARLSDSIAVELPASGETRSRIFRIEAELSGAEPTPDVGQRYMLVYFD